MMRATRCRIVLPHVEVAHERFECGVVQRAADRASVYVESHRLRGRQLAVIRVLGGHIR